MEKEMLENLVCSKCLNSFKEPFYHSDHTLANSKNRASLTCVCSNCNNTISVRYIIPEYKIYKIKEVDLLKIVNEINATCDEYIYLMASTITRETQEKVLDYIEVIKKYKLDYNKLKSK